MATEYRSKDDRETLIMWPLAGVREYSETLHPKTVWTVMTFENDIFIFCSWFGSGI